MTILNFFIVSKSGGLIYDFCNDESRTIVEKTFSFPLEIDLRFDRSTHRFKTKFEYRDHGLGNDFSLLSIKGKDVKECSEEEIFRCLTDSQNFPLTLKFAKASLTVNEKIILASMFTPIFAMSAQLSPELGSSGIEMLETETFRLHCLQTYTGLKFISVSDLRQTGLDHFAKRCYQLYSDYAVKNPFYSLEMPIRCSLFDEAVHSTIKIIEKRGCCDELESYDQYLQNK